MYEVPSTPTIEQVIIDDDCVKGEGKPHFRYNPNKKATKLEISKKHSPKRKTAI